MIIPFILIAFIAFCVVVIIKKSKYKNKYNREPAIKQQAKNPASGRKLATVEAMHINSRGVQLLESLDIIASTKNIETLSSRIRFILVFYDSLIDMASYDRYINEANMAINTYVSRYPDKALNDSKITLLTKPNIDILKQYFSNCIVICYGDHVKSQALEISKLTREHAINTRKQKLIETGYRAKYMFKTFELPDSGHTEAIEEIRKQFYFHRGKSSS